jgi:hypothetical protein
MFIDKLNTIDRTPAANSTLAIGGVLSPFDSLVVAKSVVFRIYISGKNPTNQKSAIRWWPL